MFKSHAVVLRLFPLFDESVFYMLFYTRVFFYLTSLGIALAIPGHSEDSEEEPDFKDEKYDDESEDDIDYEEGEYDDEYEDDIEDKELDEEYVYDEEVEEEDDEEEEEEEENEGDEYDGTFDDEYDDDYNVDYDSDAGDSNDSFTDFEEYNWLHRNFKSQITQI